MIIVGCIAFVIATVVLLFVVLALIQYFKEKKAWNNGRCPNCGHEWYCVGTHLQNPRPLFNYKCRNCFTYTGFLFFDPEELK
jgi:hypothetical protein